MMACEPSNWLFQYIYAYLGTISIIVALLSGAAHLIHNYFYGIKLALDRTMAKVVAGFVLPPIIAMAISVFDLKHLLACVENLELYVLAGAISVGWITWGVLFPQDIKKPHRAGSDSK
jgi:hypothetical protein